MGRTKKREGQSRYSDAMQVVTERIKQIDYDFSKFTIPDFTQWVASKRGIIIHLEPCDGLTVPTGFWFMMTDGAHIKYGSALSPTLEIITILHELMHIYLGHETKHISADLPLLQFCQGIATRNPAQQSREDQEAETAAVLIYERSLNRGEVADINPVSDLFGEAD